MWFMVKLATVTMPLPILGFVAFAGLQPAIPNQQTQVEKGPDDHKRLQGEWQVLDLERNGKGSEQDPTSLLMAFKGDELTTNKGKAKYKLDPQKSPREIDITFVEGPSKNKTARCIYSLENGELKLCFPGNDGVRPKEFKTKAGDGLMLVVLRHPETKPPAKIKREWQRPNAPPDGIYKLSAVDRELEETLCLIKLETKNAKQSGSLVDAASDLRGLKILQTVVEPTPPPSPPKAGGKPVPQGAHVRISLRGANGDVVFEGDFTYGSLEARGSLQTNQRFFPATLSAADLVKLKFTSRDIMPSLMEKTETLETRGWFLRAQAQKTKDAAEKARLLGEAALADKVRQTEIPKLYREVFEKYADQPAIFNLALRGVKGATKYERPAEQIRDLIARADKTAASFGRKWRLEFSTQIADALAPQKAYTAVALEVAAQLEKQLLPSDSAETQARALKAVAAAQGNAGNVAKMEEILDREYRARVPPFQGDSFTGRKANSARTVVLELFTGAQCGPCVSADVAFEVLQKTYKSAELVLIQYHLHIPGPDPLTNADSESRWQYYKKAFPDKVLGTPSTLFNGKPEVGGGGSMAKAEEKYQQYRHVIDPLLETTSSAKLAVSAVKQDNKIDIAVSVTDLAKPGGDTRLRLVLVEESIRYLGGNKVRFHCQVVRKLVGGPDGFALKDKDSKHTASVDLDELRKSLNSYLDDYNTKQGPFPSSDRPLDFNNLRLIALVQDDTTREILQATQVEIAEAKAAGK